jgi:hypothetical protein
MKKRLFFLVLPTLFAFELAGCGSGSDADLSGNWSGTVKTITGNVASNTVPPSTIKASLSKNGTIITGNVSVESVGGSYAGTLSGTFNGSALTANLTPIDATKCPYTATLVYSDNKLTGQGTAYNCTVNSAIDIALTR